MNKQRKVVITTTYNEMGIIIDTKAEEVAQPNLQPTCNQLATEQPDVPDTNVGDLISRQAAIDAIMGQPPEPHYPTWYAAQIEKIPCSERLPKKTGYYLTTNEYKVVHEEFYWGSGCFEKARKYQCEVVAWMPMPIPPYCGDNGE